MKQFMDKDFLLNSETSRKLFHEYAENMPIIDYHCHINPREIAEDRHFENITRLWLGGDHYKWRFMRSMGIDEKLITGDATDKEKFFAWAECLGKAVGNPLYHWSHLELQRYFGYYGHLNRNTAEEVWKLCNLKLSEPSMSAKNIIINSNVKLVCTTDDPIDDLRYHKEIKADKNFKVKVLPAWRPDRAMNIEKDDYLDYLSSLAQVSGVNIHSFETLIEALLVRMDYFAENGCKVSDHGLEYVSYVPSTKEDIDSIFSKRAVGEHITKTEELAFKTAVMLKMGAEYKKRGWVMQLHYGCKRDNNRVMYQRIGADTGFDCINDHTPSYELAEFLNALEEKNALGRTILYSLNPNDNAAIGTILGCFQNSDAIAKIQQGSAWWFNDHKIGMYNQISSLAALGNLSGFVGMLTDSRSFISYTRHEYFRRILCDYLGTLVENGEYPADFDTLKEIVEDICFNNAVRYFNFSL